jgi:hypothetical protein
MILLPVSFQDSTDRNLSGELPVKAWQIREITYYSGYGFFADLISTLFPVLLFKLLTHYSPSSIFLTDSHLSAHQAITHPASSENKLVLQIFLFHLHQQK